MYRLGVLRNGVVTFPDKGTVYVEEDIEGVSYLREGVFVNGEVKFPVAGLVFETPSLLEDNED